MPVMKAPGSSAYRDAGGSTQPRSSHRTSALLIGQTDGVRCCDIQLGAIQNAMTAYCSRAPAITSEWKTSWYPKTEGRGSGRLASGS